MLSLNDDKAWSALSDAYGPATTIPKLLVDAEALPEDTGHNDEPYFSLWSALCHQGDVYAASYAALPHLLRIIEENPNKFRWTLLSLVEAIETGRLKGRGPVIPDDLHEAYERATKRVPAVSARIMDCNELTELELRVLLSACASVKGFAQLAEAINELTPENIARLLEDIGLK
jgi:hypothetical protein